MNPSQISQRTAFSPYWPLSIPKNSSSCWIPPGVVLAGELAAGAGRLLGGEVVPDQLVAPVPADVVEGADLPVLAPHQDQRRVRDRELLGEVAAGPGQALHPPDVEPGPFEDRRPFGLVTGGIDGIAVIDRAGAELGIVGGPAPLGGLGEVGPGIYLSCSGSTPKVMKAIASRQ
jgi:hypothetical protein